MIDDIECNAESLVDYMNDNLLMKERLTLVMLDALASLQLKIVDDASGESKRVYYGRIGAEAGQT